MDNTRDDTLMPDISLDKKNKFSFIWLLGILALTLALYLPVLNYTWITGTDQQLITENFTIQSLTSENIYNIFFSSSEGKYTPLSSMSLALDIYMSPVQANKHIHLMNLLLHLLNIILFFRFVHLLSTRPLLRISATLLFAINPINVMTITLMSSRGYLLGAFFLLLALLAYVYSIKSSIKRNRHYNMGLVFFLLAALTNPIAIVYPVATLLLDKALNRDMSKTLKEKVPIIALSVIILSINLYSQWSYLQAIPAHQGQLLSKILYSPFVFSSLFIKSVVPVGLSIYHPVPSGVSLLNIGLFLIFVLLFLIAWIKSGNQWVQRFSILFFLSGLLLAIVFSLSEPGLYSENYAYIPSLGLFLLFGVSIQDLFEAVEKRARKISYSVFFLLGVYAIALAYVTDIRVSSFENSETVWTDVIKQYPDDGKAFFRRGDYWAMNGRFDRAKFDYSQCIRRNPNAFYAMNNLGLIYMEEGDLWQALARFNEALEINPQFFKSHLNKGIVHMRMDKNELALESMNLAVDLKPRNSLAYYNRGLVYERLNSLPDAISDFSAAISLDPYQFQYYKDRGKAFVWMGDFAAAELDYSKAIAIDPGNAEIWFRRSLSRSQQDKFAEALEDAFMAQSLGFPVEEEYIRGISAQVLQDDIQEER